jgi:hypothetical protein
VFDGGTLFEAGLTIVADGGPHAYHPDSKSGLDNLYDAGNLGHWWALVTDSGKPDGNPVIQGKSDPAPGYYVSTTGLEDVSKDKNNPKRYVDSETIPYICLSSALTRDAGIRLGDIAAVLNREKQQLCYAVYAEVGPSNKLGLGSIALAKSLGLPSDPKVEGGSSGIIYKIFPGSATGWPKTPEEINAAGEPLLQAWGGKQRLLNELSRNSSVAGPK